MNKTCLWIVAVVTATWIGFLFGYATSAHTGAKHVTTGTPAAQSAGAGGYGR